MGIAEEACGRPKHALKLGGEVSVGKRSRLKPLLLGGSSRGQALVEFAVIFLIFIGLVFATVDFGRLFYLRLMIHGAVREASRFTVTGNVLPDPDNPGQFLSRLDSIVAKLRSAAPTANLLPTAVTIIGPRGAGDPGQAGELVTIRVDYDIELITPIVRPLFPGGVDHYSVSILSQNEPFDE
jgi:hypothetical protein